jgi:cell division protein FtsW (lipid II flippase)
MRPLNGSAPLAWVAAVGFLIAASWPNFSESELPLTGLRSMTAPHVGWPLAAVTLMMALFLSCPSIFSRDRLLVFAGFSLCLFLVVAFYVSPVAALMPGFIAANIIRETVKPDPSLNADAQKRHAG